MKEKMIKIIKKKFPFLKKIRKKQIIFVFYLKMYLDRNKYCKQIVNEELTYSLPTYKDKTINTETGYPIEYQYNKVFNLKLASKQINHILIKPNETFSLQMRLKNADKKEKYKKGLISVKGEVDFVEGGGLCQLSNLLFQVFLNSPLTIIERHTHKVKEFPDPMQDSLKGIDSTIADGFLDLKVRNDTDNVFQICITFDDKYIYGSLKSKNKINSRYKITNRDLKYIKIENKIYEYVDVYKQEIKEDGKVEEEKLYTNKTQIGYELPKNIEIEVEDTKND